MLSTSKRSLRRNLAPCLLAVVACAVLFPPACATVHDPAKPLSQSVVSSAAALLSPSDYIRTDFTVEDGLPDDVINAIVETQNGLLWVGTGAGLARFDGREFIPISLHTAGHPAQGGVHALLESSSGDLWVGTDVGVVRVPKAALDQFNPAQLTYFRLGAGPSNGVGALLQAHNGAIWAGTTHGLFREESGKFIQVIPEANISRVAETLDGHLLLISESKIIAWDGHKAITRSDLAASIGVPERDVYDIFQNIDGTIWFSTQEGIFRRGSTPLPVLVPIAASTTTSFRRPYPDPQGHLWVVNGVGVYRLNGNTLEDTPVPNVHPRCFYPDREGGYWVGTNGNGLIHLKHRAVRMFTTADGLINNTPMAVLSSHDGKLWIGCNCGLSVYDGKQFWSYAEEEGLSNSCVWSLAEDHGRNLWIGTYGGGLFRFSDGHFQQYSVAQGLPNTAALQIAVAHDGSLWIATPSGVSHMENGRFRNYTTSDGLSSNQVLSVYQDHSGTIWAATQGGLGRRTGEQSPPFQDPQPKDGAIPIRFAEDSLGDLYTMNSPSGISLVKENRLVQVNETLKLFDMVESPEHGLWLSGTSGILRIRSSDLRSSLDEHDTPLAYEIIDCSDGLISIQCSVGSPNMAITPDGKLWVATVKGLAMLDPNDPLGAGRKPKVFVGAVTDGANQFLAGNETVLPPGTHHVELHLEAVDLTSPEKIQLQYRMDGVDSTWLDASGSRIAVYTGIPIGAHAFHVRASGSDGVWDRNGIVYIVTQRPYFYQTTWFFVVCFGLLAFLAWEASQWRVRQAQARAHLQTEERLSERARIARALHDTLLQSLQGLILKFQRARNLLPGRPEQAMESLDAALDTAERAVMEGRDAIHDIRALAPTGDFAQEISALGNELSAEYSAAGSPPFQVVVEGNPQPIRADVHDELYRIAREAIRNDFAHARAKRIEAEIRFEEQMLRMRIRDDGIGIGEQHLGEAGRAGHYGLRGMRERAARLDGQLDVWTEAQAGTEIELRIPARIAYQTDDAAKNLN